MSTTCILKCKKIESGVERNLTSMKSLQKTHNRRYMTTPKRSGISDLNWGCACSQNKCHTGLGEFLIGVSPKASSTLSLHPFYVANGRGNCITTYEPATVHWKTVSDNFVSWVLGFCSKAKPCLSPCIGRCYAIVVWLKSKLGLERVASRWRLIFLWPDNSIDEQGFYLQAFVSIHIIAHYWTFVKRQYGEAL